MKLVVVSTGTPDAAALAVIGRILGAVLERITCTATAAGSNEDIVETEIASRDHQELSAKKMNTARALGPPPSNSQERPQGARSDALPRTVQV